VAFKGGDGHFGPQIFSYCQPVFEVRNFFSLGQMWCCNIRDLASAMFLVGYMMSIPMGLCKSWECFPHSDTPNITSAPMSSPVWL
jgi:hypothetical protein